MTHKRIERLTVEADLASTPLDRRLSERIGDRRVQARIPPTEYHRFGRGDLVLTRHMGRFVKPCPGTPAYVCCGLAIIHFGLGCWLDCSYCILQGYLDTNAQVLFGNWDQGLAEVEAAVNQPGRPRRFCTGEFTDSLLLEPYTGLGAELARRFAEAPDAVLELKTKTVNVDGLLDLDHRGRTIISFSLNAPDTARREESKAPSVKQRLEAARRAAEAGYRIGFHFDPIIRRPGWEEGYRQTIDQMFEAVDPSRVAWISMGCFRYLPPMKNTVLRRRPHTRIMDQEFVLAPDGKMRYVRPLRVDVYGRVLELIRAADPEACVYMCMESPRVWREVFGRDMDSEGLTALLDDRV